jgi:glycosyltransferase involved in cell wall biosynthesis
MIRVAHIITGLKAGGAEMMLYKLLCRMDRRRFEPIVISLTPGGEFAPRIAALGIPALGASSLATMWRWRPDVVQGWMYHGNLAAQMAAAALPNKTPVIWNVRGSHHILREEKPGTAAVIRIGARLSRLPYKIVNNSAASARLHEQYLNFTHDRWEIIPNGFELEQFAPSDGARHELRAELAISPGALLIGLIGRYHPMKDHASFIQGAGLLSKNFPEAQFLFAGAGAEPGNAVLRRQIQESGIAHCAHLLGARTDMARINAALDIATSASYAEGFPNVIGEAMCCGVPCVVTDVGDSARLVGDTGVVVPPRMSYALAAAWRDLIVRGAEGRRAMGQKARERIARHFSMAAVAARYEDLYQGAHERSAGRRQQPCAA